MTVTREHVLTALEKVELPDGGTLVSRDLVRALIVDEGAVRFVIEADSPEAAQKLASVRKAAEDAISALQGVNRVSVALTAHGPAAKSDKAAPSLKLGRHPTQQPDKQSVPGVKNIIAVGSGKGGVGKSTVASNLAVALARHGLRVGLLDADIYGPSQPRMMGVDRRPASPDGKSIIPLKAHGVTMISIGLMLKEDDAVIWRGPMLMGALQQLLTQVEWGALDVLIVDMPPGTGDIQLTLCSKFDVRGAIVVSTPQDVALLDARKALRAFHTLKTPVLGLIENMSTFICPKCGHEEHIFGEGGVRLEAEKQGLSFLGELPLSVEVRLAGDGGVPVAATDSPVAKAYERMAARVIESL
ncbi:Mrp/NBP35 family ATP-binding protein [Roseinatronobacter bogoriensis]|uniref:Iron-sulfur cluster carrier protein n=1 Tax=Roseinatronobacter bogoriensis subsp. barguzinensis TaxID=441209 RepID=A0A2K8KMV0_9RHOB|nr:MULTISPECIES: Mrp/NBP35 family ATP-binding protein [Rhodobaca]ATX67910.1 iron-sulfur cluster carrier protein ApbC [Rhodobaca barguzinensis]MBB4206227.1 ATP-binding protein involved in chromosome partitioning [Rhodobaca bogoriensis DSM 18756]TDW40971.1 ATP-binding protein involved in chromosome partitioning [Rhodobaca barguzinensis]TDY74851.1 ATP-binding protein involved in chromosome partitioning [Rhodobaca bogoriensis DSM 18756]